MNTHRLAEKFNESGKTQLCIGPMSLNCVNAGIELAYEYDVELMFIASRRQIECSEFGGGYVNNWDTFSFANYIRAKDPKNKIVIARDHGGPWQHPLEWDKCKSIKEAMESAKLSFSRDIEAGFQVIHIDPVLNRNDQKPTTEWVLDKIYELYIYCLETAKKYDKEILIEIGTEEQGESPIVDPSELEDLLEHIIHFCESNNLQKPTFIVVQTGTKVMGMQNTGDFPAEDSEIKHYVEKYQFRRIVDICEQWDVKIKEHNADYLSENSLRIHPIVGIHAVNAAPEFGVVETNALLSVMERISAHDELNEFIQICLNSKKWTKWVIGFNDISDLEKTKICGHYLFSDEKVIQIKDRVREKFMAQFNEDLDTYLKDTVKRSILKYMKCFNMVK